MSGPTTKSPPFMTLSAMQHTHRELLLQRRSTVDEASNSDLQTAVLQFIRRGRTAGALIELEDERATAQNLLDFWENRLLYLNVSLSEPALLNDFDPSHLPELADDLCPYVGLEAFRASDHTRFFGRDQLIDHLLQQTALEQPITVIGPSGSGKSSVILAGLLPRLRDGGLADSKSWHYFQPVIPGSTPLIQLANLLRPPNVDPAAWLAETLDQFQKSANHLLMLINERARGKTAVLAIDQFEETFTLCNDKAERTAFIQNLLTLCMAKETSHKLILTMRTDYEGHLANYPKFENRFKKGEVRVDAMTAAELHDAIFKPAAAVGLRFEEGLPDALIRDVLGEPAALPLLQFALLQLWDNRQRNRVTWAVYRQLGNVTEALANTADNLYESLIPEEKFTIRRLLLRIINPSERIEPTRTRRRRSALYDAGEANDRVDRVLDKLIQARLVRLTKGSTAADDQVEVAHEALVRNWPKLVDWLDEDRVLLRRRHRLEEQASQWDALGRPSDLLLRGALLNEAREFKGLDPVTIDFVQAGIAEQERLEREKEFSRQKELTQARELAEEQRQRAEAQAVLAQQAKELASEKEQRIQAQTSAITRLRYLIIAISIFSILGFISVALLFQLNNQIGEQEDTITENNNVITNQSNTIATREDNIEIRLTTEAGLDGTITSLEVTAQVATAQALAIALTKTVSPTITPTATPTQTPTPILSNAEATSIALTPTIEPTFTPTAQPTITPQPTATLSAAQLHEQFRVAADLNTILRPDDSMPMLFITGNPYLSGVGEAIQQPSLPSFYIDRYEISVQQYARFLNELGEYRNACNGFYCALTKFETLFTFLRNDFSVYQAEAGRGNYPINNVSYHGAIAYCESVGARLPTAEEWEYAARGVDGRSYPWGNEPPTNNLAVFNRTGSSAVEELRSADSMTEGISPFGVFNMSGNVAEWVNISDETDARRTQLGGSWLSSASAITVISATQLPADIRQRNLPPLNNGRAYEGTGFRCAQDAP